MPDQFKDNPLLYCDTLLKYHGIDPGGLPDAKWLFSLKTVLHLRELDQKPLTLLLKALTS